MATISTTDKLINEIEVQRQALATHGYVLNIAQQALLDKAIELWNEDETSMAKRSSQQRGRRTRVRKFLVHVAENLAYEAVLLCAISFSITRLAEIQPILFRPLVKWWAGVENPIALQTVTEKGLRDNIEATATDRQPASSLEAVLQSPVAALTHRKRHLDLDESITSPSSTDDESEDEDSEANDRDEDDGDEHGEDDKAEAEDIPRQNDGEVTRLPDGKLTGNVYELSPMDAIRVLSHHTGVKVWLTIPVHKDTEPFVTFSCSRPVSMQFLTRRPQLM